MIAGSGALLLERFHTARAGRQARVRVAARVESALAQAPRLGSPGAPLKIVMFSDFECPACHRGAAILDRFLARHADQAEVRFVNVPLSRSCNPEVPGDLHPLACLAAKIGLSMGRRGKFWDYHRAVMEGPSELSESRLWTVVDSLLGAREAELVRAEVGGAEVAEALMRDLLVARAYRVNGTPTWLINGERWVGALSESTWAERLAEALASEREPGRVSAASGWPRPTPGAAGADSYGLVTE